MLLRKKSFVLLLTMFCLGTQILVSYNAEARAGGGRSIGRSSGRSSGSYQRYSAPSNSAYGRQTNPNYNSGYNNQGYPPPQQRSSGGGFMRGLAGGLAGGFLGSMLYSAIGNSSPGIGGALNNGVTGGGGRGGIGILEILLIAGAALLAFRWFKKRQEAATYPGAYSDDMLRSSGPRDVYQQPAQEPFANYEFPALSKGIATDDATDIFFKIQGAWTRKNLSLVSHLLTSEIQSVLERDLDVLRREQRVNRLENITVRSTHVLESWSEDDGEYSTVAFTANLLDYTVDEKTGAVVEGSDSVPVKFNEDWTFCKPRHGQNWQLAGIRVG